MTSFTDHDQEPLTQARSQRSVRVSKDNKENHKRAAAKKESLTKLDLSKVLGSH